MGGERMSPEDKERLDALMAVCMENHRLRTIIDACDVHIAQLKARMARLERHRAVCAECDAPIAECECD
jgi:hypothetical protein